METKFSAGTVMFITLLSSIFYVLVGVKVMDTFELVDIISSGLLSTINFIVYTNMFLAVLTGWAVWMHRNDTDKLKQMLPINAMFVITTCVTILLFLGAGYAGAAVVHALVYLYAFHTRFKLDKPAK